MSKRAAICLVGMLCFVAGGMSIGLGLAALAERLLWIGVALGGGIPLAIIGLGFLCASIEC